MWRKRGRPRSKVKIDLGTLELRQKREKDWTIEPLDLCAKRHLITKEEHSAGIKFRWLFSLCYGHLKLRAYDPSLLMGRSLLEHSEKRLKYCQSKYNKIIERLSIINAVEIISDICIHNHTPSFLKNMNMVNLNISYSVTRRFYDFDKFKEGMELLKTFIENDL